MEKGFILSLIFAAIIAVFALSNSDKVFIDLFFTEVEMSQAIVILISALFGAVVAAIFSWVKNLKQNKKIKILKNEVETLTQTNNELKDHLKEKDKQIKDLSIKTSNSSCKEVKLITEGEKDVECDMINDNPIKIDTIIKDEN